MARAIGISPPLLKPASRLRKIRVIMTAAVCMACFVFFSCASAPEYPVYSPPTTRVLPADFDEVFKAALSVLREDARLELHTIDNAGRFIAMEKVAGFIFFRHRTILDIRLEPVERGETKISMILRAEDYEMGGFTRPAGWYPSHDVDTFLGEDILGLIEKRVGRAAR
jgi:hypothetical protein